MEQIVLLNDRYYQYNDFLWIRDNWEDGGNIELLFTKNVDNDRLTYEDLGIDSVTIFDFDIIGMSTKNKIDNVTLCKTIINGKYKYDRILLKKKSPLSLLISRLIINHKKKLEDRMRKYPIVFGYTMNKNGSIKLDNPDLEVYIRIFWDNYHEFGGERAIELFKRKNELFKRMGSEPIPKEVMDWIGEGNFKKYFDDNK